MNSKKILAVIAAVCLTAGYVPYDYENPVSAGSTEAYAEEEASTNIVIQCVGDKAPVSITGTTEKPEWYSDNEAIASVTSDGEYGAVITAVGKGKTAVYAVLSKQLIRFDVTVLKETADEKTYVTVGTIKLTNEQSSASSKLDGVDASEAEWKSSDESVAVVDKKGNITAVGAGKCEITAVYKNTVYTINVVSEFDPSKVPEPVEKFIGEMRLTDNEPAKKLSFEVPDGTVIKFSSTDESVAVVDDEGKVTAKGSGQCRIYAEIGNVKNYLVIISTYTGKNTPGNTDLGEVKLTAAEPSQKISLSNLPAGAKVTWKSTDESVATVTQNGVIAAVGKGVCKVIADVDGTEYTLEVTVDINDISELPVTVIKGIGSTMTIQNTTADMKFTTSDANVAVVDEKGVITTKGEGYAVIIAESENFVSYLRLKVEKVGMMGDANLDGRVTIADATAVLQNLGNPDKYGFTDEQVNNSDVDGVLGLTGSDAYTIQLFEAGVISSLPLAPQS